MVGLGGMFVKTADLEAWKAWWARLPRVNFEDFGRFGWLIDPAGVKVEPWEPRGPSPV